MGEVEKNQSLFRERIVLIFIPYFGQSIGAIFERRAAYDRRSLVQRQGKVCMPYQHSTVIISSIDNLLQTADN